MVVLDEGRKVKGQFQMGVAGFIMPDIRLSTDLC